MAAPLSKMAETVDEGEEARFAPTSSGVAPVPAMHVEAQGDFLAHESNKGVWIELCEGLRAKRGGQFITEKTLVLECAFSYLCFLDESNEVEKNFVVLQEAEYKKRERHCSMQSLSDILRICIGIPESIDMLVTRVARENGTCEFAPKTLIQKAQDI